MARLVHLATAMVFSSGLLVAGTGGHVARAKVDATGPSLPPSASVSRPEPGVHRPSPLLGVSSVVRADVASLRYELDDQYGPRTVAALANTVIIAGAAPVGNEISELGGPLPDGSVLGVSDSPRLEVGGEYYFFLGSDPWLYSPIWADLVFRVVHSLGRDYVVGMAGYPVAKFDSNGISFAGQRVANGWACTPSPADDLGSVSETGPAPAGLVPGEFVASALAAMTSVGAPLNKLVSLSPTWQGRWDEVPTSPGQ